jgi:hypothetical protein
MGSTILMKVKCHHDIPSWFFFQFFNFENLAKTSKKLAKLVKATLGKISKYFQTYYRKKIVRKNTPYQNNISIS